MNDQPSQSLDLIETLWSDLKVNVVKCDQPIQFQKTLIFIVFFVRHTD